MLMEIEMIHVKGGTFQMGCLFGYDPDCSDDEKPEHTVTLSDFEIGKYPVTQAQWKAIMGDNPSHFIGDELPVESVGWHDAQAYCEWLSKKTGNNYRLPSEAEWEFAARGGILSEGYKYAGGNDLDKVGWYWENSGEKRLSGKWELEKLTANNCCTHPVGEKEPNELGLYDMSGNVWEWCWDWYDSKYYETHRNAPENNPRGPKSGLARVLRGGSWYNDSYDCRVGYRINVVPRIGVDNVGFRLAQDK